MKDMREISSDDPRAWKLSPETNWAKVILAVAFVTGSLILAGLMVFHS